MSAPSQPALVTAVEQRYASLANSCCSLSCGEALDLAAPVTGEVFVDLGCGRGQDVIRAAGRVGRSGKAIGVDRTQAMIDKARSAVPPFLANVRFVCCDLAALDLDDGYANVVISNCTINHATDKEAVYREIGRVLAAGGRFVVSDVVADHELPESVRSDPEAWAACYGGAIPEGDYLAAVARAGFVDVEVLHRTAPHERGGVMVKSLTIRGFRGPRKENDHGGNESLSREG
jgi:SAM-dependent methyltransferase